MRIINLMKWLGAIGIGHAGAEILNHIFDILLYSTVIWLLGPIWGGAVIIPISMIWDFGMIKLYDQTKTDWLGFETLQERSVQKRLSRMGLGLIKTFLFLFFVWWDPPRAFLLVRSRKLRNNSFTTLDWKLFVAINLAGNLIWILVLTKTFEVIRRSF